MSITKKQWTIIGVIIAIIAVWYFFMRNKKVTKAESSWIQRGGCKPGELCSGGTVSAGGVVSPVLGGSTSTSGTPVLPFNSPLCNKPCFAGCYKTYIQAISGLPAGMVPANAENNLTNCLTACGW